jgi:fluoroquinolone transport system permease protein
VRSLRIILRVIPVDLLNVRRDPLLAWIPLLPIFLAALYRFGVPPVSDWLIATRGVGLEPFHPLLMSMFLLLVPAVVGMMTGFLLLDERDDRTLEALRVTPLPLEAYLGYRIALPTLLGLVLTLLAYPLTGMLPMPVTTLLIPALLGSLMAPLVMLFLASFAENKVAGFAMVKLMNGLLLIPLVAYLVEEPWQYVAGVIPSFWAMKVFWATATGEPALLALGVGLAVNVLAGWVLLRRFRAVVER